MISEKRPQTVLQVSRLGFYTTFVLEFERWPHCFGRASCFQWNCSTGFFNDLSCRRGCSQWRDACVTMYKNRLRPTLGDHVVCIALKSGLVERPLVMADAAWDWEFLPLKSTGANKRSCGRG